MVFLDPRSVAGLPAARTAEVMGLLADGLIHHVPGTMVHIKFPDQASM